ncbi:hypothetical protein GCE9029_00001 [Grimontia celer]|uniref:Uncharacterized protein n=1 Tax=Grimontia celer TaxID=1796497 RepID=A0A128ESJ4_9GAMM|nr:hypothetical protein GCE9029_00001 [Grimontia celer]
MGDTLGGDVGVVAAGTVVTLGDRDSDLAFILIFEGDGAVVVEGGKDCALGIDRQRHVLDGVAVRIPFGQGPVSGRHDLTVAVYHKQLDGHDIRLGLIINQGMVSSVAGQWLTVDHLGFGDALKAGLLDTGDPDHDTFMALTEVVVFHRDGDHVGLAVAGVNGEGVRERKPVIKVSSSGITEQLEVNRDTAVVRHGHRVAVLVDQLDGEMDAGPVRLFHIVRRFHDDIDGVVSARRTGIFQDRVVDTAVNRHGFIRVHDGPGNVTQRHGDAFRAFGVIIIDRGDLEGLTQCDRLVGDTLGGDVGVVAAGTVVTLGDRDSDLAFILIFEGDGAVVVEGGKDCALGIDRQRHVLDGVAVRIPFGQGPVSGRHDLTVAVYHKQLDGHDIRLGLIINQGMVSSVAGQWLTVDHLGFGDALKAGLLDTGDPDHDTFMALTEVVVFHRDGDHVGLAVAGVNGEGVRERKPVIKVSSSGITEQLEVNRDTAVVRHGHRVAVLVDQLDGEMDAGPVRLFHIVRRFHDDIDGIYISVSHGVVHCTLSRHGLKVTTGIARNGDFLQGLSALSVFIVRANINGHRAGGTADCNGHGVPVRQGDGERLVFDLSICGYGIGNGTAFRNGLLISVRCQSQGADIAVIGDSDARSCLGVQAFIVPAFRFCDREGFGCASLSVDVITTLWGVIDGGRGFTSWNDDHLPVAEGRGQIRALRGIVDTDGQLQGVAFVYSVVA